MAKLSQEQQNELIKTLKNRFDQYQKRHSGITWEQVETRLLTNPNKLLTLFEMERTGGEPDLVKYDKKSGTITFIDCSKQSPAGRRSLCYDQRALDARKANKPTGSALAMAQQMGIGLLTEEDYRFLQTLGEFDTTTSSWIKTPTTIRELGGALFCDRRYNSVFVYHNGAESYYAARGFRGSVTI